MKNLSDLASKMSDEANIVGPETDDLKIYGGVNFIALDIDDAATLNPLTHIYQYDLGFPPPLQQRIAEKFNTR
jgi:23S rRNA U2552 (ribose-2'-O)-methylase RlmE/FtsJ